MNDNWATPQYLFDKLDKEFHFEFDLCADTENSKCERYFTKEIDSLKQSWPSTRCYNGSLWMNPPYGRSISLWMKKAYEHSRSGSRIVALVPNRSNAPWWHDYVMKAKEIRFIRKKVPVCHSVRQ